MLWYVNDIPFATYKLCWLPVAIGGCFETDILTGFDVAFSDGGDVLSMEVL